MVDLTTLEGMDTDGKVRALCAKALHPDPTDPTCPAVAAVCVYGDLVATTRACVGDRARRSGRHRLSQRAGQHGRETQGHQAGRGRRRR